MEKSDVQLSPKTSQHIRIVDVFLDDIYTS